MHLSTRRSTLSTAVAALALTTLLGACAGPADEQASSPESPASTSASSESPSSEPSRTPRPKQTSEAPAGPVLEVTVEGEQVSPNAEEISLDTGQPLTISFTADRAGELHVHSKPEQYVDFGTGKSQQRLVIETPGTVEIEEHDSGAVVAVVEVS